MSLSAIHWAILAIGSVAGQFDRQFNDGAAQAIVAKIEFNQDLQEKNTLGQKKAGVLCLPDGAVSKRDIDLEGQAQKALNDYFADQSVLNAGIQSVIIDDVKLSLCAKTYLPFGVGATNGYSGTISVVMHLRKGDQLFECAPSKVKIKEPDAMPNLWNFAFARALSDCVGSAQN